MLTSQPFGLKNTFILLHIQPAENKNRLKTKNGLIWHLQKPGQQGIKKLNHFISD